MNHSMLNLPLYNEETDSNKISKINKKTIEWDIIIPLEKIQDGVPYIVSTPQTYKGCYIYNMKVVDIMGEGNYFEDDSLPILKYAIVPLTGSDSGLVVSDENGGKSTNLTNYSVYNVKNYVSPGWRKINRLMPDSLNVTVLKLNGEGVNDF